MLFRTPSSSTSYATAGRFNSTAATPLAGAHWWSSFVAPGLALESAAGSDRVLRVRYEDLVLKPESAFRRICDFVGIGFVEPMIGGGGVKLSPYAADVHGNVGKPPQLERLDAWKEMLEPAEIRAFTQANAALLHWLDYRVAPHDWQVTANIGTRITWALKETVSRHFVKPLRQKMRRRSKRVYFKTK